MDFSDEPYVRVYKRKTTTMAVVGWQARAVLRELFLVVDRAGVLDLDDEDPADAVAAVLGDLPVEVVRDSLERLLRKGCVVITGSTLVIPRFREAQEVPASDRLRARESRERRRCDALGCVTKRDGFITSTFDTEGEDERSAGSGDPGEDPREMAGVTNRDAPITKRDGQVTNCNQTVTTSHAASHAVTQSRAEQSKIM